MNILFVTPHMVTGGAEKMITDLSKGLLSKGHTVGIATSGGHLLEEMAEAGAKIHVNPLLAQRKPFQVFRSGLWLSRVIRKHRYQVINSHSLITTWMSKLGSTLSLQFPQKIFTMHLIENPNVFRYIRIMTRFTTDAIITVSDSNKKRLIDAGVSSQKIHVVHNGINIGKFPYIKRKQSSTLTIGIIARLIPRKGHEIFFNAISNVDKKIKGDWARVLVIGWGPLEKQLQMLCSQLQINHIVEFLGDRHDVPELLEQMDTLTLPSYYEGFPIAIMEGMSTGVTVIATAVDGIPEIIEHEKNGLLIHPGNIEELERAIERVNASYELRTQLGRAASEIVQSNFSTEKMTVNTERVFNTILKSTA
ncbi:MAG: glycosyltransferase family 4 protein [SAR202 cluster bacterium]|nr:glycosyltransferase family 4 protein [SAR202 cluster bacterium]|tara:strand:- start:540 stop:1628 length:1089 start_codon:yes stop_codon:yes gene_type:complete